MIVVTGATGRIGSHLVRLLAQRGERVVAVSRRVAAPHAELAGVEWRAVDLAERERLSDVMSGAEKLFLLTANSDDMVRLQKNAIAAARDAGVQHVVKLSALGASDHSRSVIALWHHSVEVALRESGIPSTMLRPHHFMDNLLQQRSNILGQGVVYSAAGEGRIPFIDTRDIAEVAAVVLREGGHEGKAYALTGPEALSYRRAAAILGEALGMRLTYVPESDDEAFVRLRREGEPTWRVAALLAIAEYQRAGGATERVLTTVSDLCGRPATTFERFARERALTLAMGDGRRTRGDGHPMPI